MVFNTTLYTQIVNSSAAVTWTTVAHDTDVDVYGLMFGKMTAANMATELDYYNDLGTEAGYRYAMYMAHYSFLLGFESEAILVEVKRTLAQIDFRKHLPENFADNYLTQRFAAVPFYGYAKDLAYQLGRWDGILGCNELAAICTIAGYGLDLADPTDNSFSSSNRYYDENAECLDFFMSMYCLDKINNSAAKTYALSTLWEFINANHWSTDHYKYTPASDIYECEGPNFCLIMAQTRARNGYTLANATLGTDYLSRILSDIDHRMLKEGWLSPQWCFSAGPVTYYCAIHSYDSTDESRMNNTLASIICLHTFYQILDATQKAAIVALISGGKQWWGKFLSTSRLFDEATHKFRGLSGGATSDGATAVGMLTLWLLGIVPDTGSLYLPIFEIKYETAALNRYCHFDSAARKIRIPVKAGNLKFLYGSSHNSTTDVTTEVIVEHYFPANGVYDVTFNAAYTQITEVTFVESLDPKLCYVAEVNPTTSTGYTSNEITSNFETITRNMMETVTLRKMVLSPMRDPDTGWYLWHYEDESATIALAPKGSAQSWNLAGKVCKYDYVGVSTSNVEVDDLIVTAYGRTLKVVTASKVWLNGYYKWTMCELEQYALGSEGSPGEPSITGNDARERILTFLNTYLVDLTPLRFIVAYDTPTYTIEKLFIEKGLDLVFGIGEPVSTMLKNCDQYPYGYRESVPVTMYAVDKGTVSATKLTYAAEAELRKELAAHPFGSLRSMDKRNKRNIEAGAFIIYATEYILTYNRDTS